MSARGFYTAVQIGGACGQLDAKQAKRQPACVRCGNLYPPSRSRFCFPCRAENMKANLARYRAAHRKPRKPRKSEISMSAAKQAEARTERVIIGFTKDEWKTVNAMRLAANREVSMAIFCRSIILDVVADDQKAHQEVAAE